MHIPVLLKEAIDSLSIKKSGKYIDATLGLGGHSLEILKRGGWILGIDADEGSLREARSRVKSAVSSDHAASRIRLVRGNFKDIKEIATENGFAPCDGVLFDLGMSSWQLEKSGRGFSFQRDEPLDMRMDKSSAVTAADLLNGLSRHELEKLFQKYGEEQSARRIASAVVRARTVKSLETTGDLTRVIEGVKSNRGKTHPATKVFQALRIAVNDEINNLRSALPQAFEVLGPSTSSGQAGGRLAVISFHSLEDREVKNFFRGLRRAGTGVVITEKPIKPSVRETRKNPRARSAKLRVVERVR